MIEYPKIETLYNRDEAFKVNPDAGFRWDEFGLVPRWHMTEKIDGTNIRIELLLDSTGKPVVTVGGRTDRAQLPTALLRVLQEQFTAEHLDATLYGNLRAQRAADAAAKGEPINENPLPKYVLYGEGYGPGIQRGGAYRKDGPAFRLFDVRVSDDWDGNGKWLDWPDVEDVARQIGIPTAPVLAENVGYQWADSFCSQARKSVVADLEAGDSQYVAEGIVARTVPYLYRWDGRRIMWKLKARDFG